MKEMDLIINKRNTCKDLKNLERRGKRCKVFQKDFCFTIGGVMPLMQRKGGGGG